MKRWLVAVFIALAVAALAWASPTDAAGPDTAQRDALNRALAIVDRGIGASSDAQARAAQDALATLNSDSDLARQSWLREPLQSRPANLPLARARIHAALAALDPAATPVGDARADRQALAAVLADPRFHPKDLTSYLPTWLVPVAVVVVSIVNAIRQVISNLLDHLFAALVDFLYSNTFTVIVLVLTAVIVPTLVVLYVRTVRGVLVAQTSVATASGVRALSGPELLEAARSAAVRGEHREACHYAFLAALRVVEDRVDLRLDYSATNREQLRRLATAPSPLAGRYGEALKPLIDRFDRVWYGQAAASEGDFQEIYALAAGLGEVSA